MYCLPPFALHALPFTTPAINALFNIYIKQSLNDNTLITVSLKLLRFILKSNSLTASSLLFSFPSWSLAAPWATWACFSCPSVGGSSLSSLFPPSCPKCAALRAALRMTLLDPCYIPPGLSKVCIVSLSSWGMP